MSGCVGVYGVAGSVVCDQGGEFESHAIASKVTGFYAPWQNGFLERHNGLLGVAWTSIIEEHRLSGRHSMKIALACALQAKTVMVTRRGYSAQPLVFGREAY